MHYLKFSHDTFVTDLTKTKTSGHGRLLKKHLTHETRLMLTS